MHIKISFKNINSIKIIPMINKWFKFIQIVLDQYLNHASSKKILILKLMHSIKL